MTGAEIRDYQRSLIRAFVESVDWRGRVLDYGCDLAPYREIVEKTAEWHGFNRVEFPSGHQKADVGDDLPLSHKWDMILCTQVFQYVPYPADLLRRFHATGATLVLTYATNWPEVENHDWFRYTRTGMEALLEQYWEIVRHEQIGCIEFGDREQLALGYGVVAT